MKKRIWSVDFKSKVFYLIIDGKKQAFYLSNRLFKTFMPYLKKGVMVDFAVLEKRKKVRGIWAYQIAYFNQIIQVSPYVVHYDLFEMRQTMKQVIKQHTHFLFMDFEMTMPGYQERQFQPEIIQVGYVLSEANGPILHEDGYYVLPKERTYLSKRTIKFLKLDQDQYFDQAISYYEFYDRLKHIIDTYQPKLVVWGKNDYQALLDSYKMYDKPMLADQNQFIDLLKLHKDYYNLKDDLGLFKAYKTYYQDEQEQDHDAITDAKITKMVFDAFLSKMT